MGKICKHSGYINVCKRNWRGRRTHCCYATGRCQETCNYQGTWVCALPPLCTYAADSDDFAMPAWQPHCGWFKSTVSC